MPKVGVEVEKGKVSKSKEIPVEDVRKEDLKRSISAAVSDGRMDRDKEKGIVKQYERFMKSPGKMSETEFSNFVGSFYDLRDEDAERFVNDVLRERNTALARNVEGKEERILEDAARITMENDLRQSVLDEELRPFIPPDTELREKIQVEGAAYSSDMSSTREEAREKAIGYADRILSEIRDDQKTIIKEYVQDRHGGLDEKEQDKLVERIYECYRVRDDKNSVTDSLKEDVSKIADFLDRIPQEQRAEEIKSILDLCKDKYQGNIAEFKDSYYNLSDRAGESNRFTEAYDELRDMLPKADRSLYSDERLRDLTKDDTLKSTLISNLDEIRDIYKSPDKVDIPKASAAETAIHEIMLENKMSSEVLNHLLSRDVPADEKLTVAVLEKDNTPDADQYSRLELARQKLEVVLDPKNDADITDNERLEVVTRSAEEIVRIEKELISQGTFTDDDTLKGLNLKHQLLEELTRQTSIANGSLNESLHGLNYTIDLRDDPYTNKMVGEKFEAREREIGQRISQLKEKIDISRSDNNGLAESLKDKVKDMDARVAAKELEKTYFSDPVRSYTLTNALRNELSGRPLTQSQKSVIDEARSICDLISQARDEDKHIEDYYSSLEWELKNSKREREFALYESRLQKERDASRLQDENAELYKEVSQSLLDRLDSTRDKLEQYMDRAERLESKKSILPSRTEELAETREILRSLKTSFLNQSLSALDFSLEYEKSLPQSSELMSDIKAELKDERAAIASAAFSLTGERLDTRSSDKSIPLDDLERAKSFNSRCIQELKDKDNRISSEKLEKLLKRPELTRVQQERFKTASSLQSVLDQERRDSIERVRRTFSAADLERMDKAIAHGLPCSVPGFNDYVSKLEEAKTEYTARTETVNADIKNIYVSHLNEVSDALNRFNTDYIRALGLTRDKTSLTKAEEQEISAYIQLSKEEKALSDLIHDKFNDERYSVSSSRYEKLVGVVEIDKAPIKEKSVARDFKSEDDARNVLRKSYNTLRSDLLDYDKCKSMAIEKHEKGSIEANLQGLLNTRYEAEQAFISAFEYLTKNNCCISDDNIMYQDAKLIYKPLYVPHQPELSKDVKEEISRRTSSIDRDAISKQRDKAVRSSRLLSFRPLGGKELDRTEQVEKREIAENELREDAARTDKIKITLKEKLADSWDMARSGRSASAAANLLSYFADKLERK